MATMSHGLTNREDWDEQYSAVTDQVYIRDLAAVSKVGVDIWGRPTTQPIKVTMIMRLDDEFDSTAEKDELDGTTVNYSRLSKQVREAIERKPDDCTTLMEFTSWITSQVKMIMAVAVAAWTIEVDLPKASALGSAIRCRVDMGKEDISTVSTNTLHLENITVPTIVGIHPHERTMKQPIVANVWLGPLTDKAPPDQYYEIEQIIVKTIEEAEAKTVEALARQIALNITMLFLFRQKQPAEVRVKIDKPNAVVLAGSSGVDMTRSSFREEGFGERAWRKCNKKTPPHPPFPLQGRLDDWMGTVGIHGKSL